MDNFSMTRILNMMLKSYEIVYIFVTVAVHLGVKMADTLSFTAKVDMVDF